MNPTFWLTIRVAGRRIPVLLPIVFPLVLILEILAILPVTIYSIRKKQVLPLKLVVGFHFSRLMLVLMLHGKAFRVNVCDGDDRVYIGGRWQSRSPQRANL